MATREGPGPTRRRRSRFASSLCLGATVVLGRASRRFALPGLLAEHVGDALYTVAAFWALAVVAPRGAAWVLATAAWLASSMVELSQLLSWQWLVELRSTSVGALFLGQGWKAQDLVAYAVGAFLALGLDAMGARLRARGAVGSR